tara:strand:+ start:723 stop:956 length:234 start_codon:yes stop_codon:yes gene_type:complete
MKGNKLIFSNNKQERIKGYKKLLKQQGDYYNPPKDVAVDIVEAMAAQGYEVDVKQVMAYLVSSYAVHDRRYYLRDKK